VQSKRDQGEKAHLPAESGLEREENIDKPKSNHFFSAKVLHRPTLEAQRRSPTEDGLIWRQLGSGQPPTGSVWPKLWSVVSHRLSNIGGIGIRGGIGPKNGGLPKIGRNQRNMPWDIPSPPPIKGRPPLLITHNTTRKKSTPHLS